VEGLSGRVIKRLGDAAALDLSAAIAAIAFAAALALRVLAPPAGGRGGAAREPGLNSPSRSSGAR
jgi:hypothetical protein